MQNKKILVTGGGGFIPSHVVRRLVKRGHDVSVLVKYNSLIDNIRLVDVWDNVNVIEADLRNLDALQQINSLKPEIIIHMAAYNHVGDSFINSNESLLMNDYLGRIRLNKIDSDNDFNKIWKWSVDNPKIFWKSVWDFTKVKGDLGNVLLQESNIFFKNKFFPDAKLNYAENLLSKNNKEILMISIQFF